MAEQPISLSDAKQMHELSSSLLARVRSQEPLAWERLVRLYAPLVYRWCRMEGLQAADAADVGQDVFAAIARNVDEFRRDGPAASFRGWVRIITRSKVADYWRQRRSPGTGAGGSGPLTELYQMADGAPSSTGQSDGDEEESRILFRRAVDLIRTDFEPTTWQAFWRSVIDDRPAAEVAAELKLTVNAVYLAKARVLRRLRQEFVDLEPI